MQIFRYPERPTWPSLLRRPDLDLAGVETTVRSIIDQVRTDGDEAIRRLTRQIDGLDIGDFAVSDAEFGAAESAVPDMLKTAIRTAKSNIEKFHDAQRDESEVVETMPGVTCWRRSVPIQRVGLYIPAGTAPLFSTVLMLAVPAVLAGCREIVLCSPANKLGQIAPEILFTARLCGVTRCLRIGGAQAIAALAYRTESVPQVDKIFGPGNSYVTTAKQMVSSHVAIDMPAGPSEVAILADETSDPAFVAADLLSQAEHGPDSQVLLVTTNEDVAQRVVEQIEHQVDLLPRAQIARAALEHSRAIIVHDVSDAVDILNEYAAEHLILAVDDDAAIADRIVNAGSIFLGHYSCESAGDYASGTNHTLPTAGFARSMSGLSVDSFVKKITYQRLTADGLRNLGPCIETMAAAEGLDAHRNAVSLRLEALK